MVQYPLAMYAHVTAATKILRPRNQQLAHSSLNFASFNRFSKMERTAPSVPRLVFSTLATIPFSDFKEPAFSEPVRGLVGTEDYNEFPALGRLPTSATLSLNRLSWTEYTGFSC
ncbi:hypothetical protein N7491_010798 [Penicillium cf. griseofulvum]|uniref:Uncharacterized protein n=1 Tax=Penicillium cf. griseofulvum TaxID=2972120 RepID=A0A9W9N1A6_9EURO|nr:hypothetical protein N7472_001122 [Penicillium cf. griseofulvum]KAJ5422353.1 hypothetical protein N7491_010798 [Penicillium cf. griseofulvum]KAJ5428536.1 hypothetical protein N7445_009990 [Penicillium cf. griseofulvum]